MKKRVVHSSLYFLFAIVVLILSVLSFLSYLSDGALFSEHFFSLLFLELVLLAFSVVFFRLAILAKGEGILLFVIGGFLFLFGLLPLLASFGLLRFLPVIVELEPSPFLLASLLFFSSVFLIVDRYFAMFRNC